MAEEKGELRDVDVRKLLPWTELFRGFQVALDPKKLILAAGGILAMALGWWLLAVIFYGSRAKPAWPSDYPIANYKDSTDRAWKAFREDRAKWNLLHEAAGSEDEFTDAADLADRPDEVDGLQIEIDNARKEGRRHKVLSNRKVYTIKPAGKMRTWPWFEDRGPNPFLVVVGKAGPPEADGRHRYVPWEKGEFLDWFLTKQGPVLIEPLVKLLRPLLYLLLQPNAGFWNNLYFLLVLLWTLGTWALFGGAITRLAAVQLARREKIALMDALRFTVQRYVSFFTAPLIPLVVFLGLVLICIVFGLFHWIPYLGDIVVDGLLWWLPLFFGLVMAAILVGLVGWPMMYATISTEGSDSFDALSRSYSYVYQSPWHYLWYCLVSLAYGAIVVFFVGFMGSLTVYLAKWAVSQTPFIASTGREPSFLFVYAPNSFGWRSLLLQGATVDGRDVVENGTIDYSKEGAYQAFTDDTHFPFNKKAGAYLVSVWLYLVFLLVVGFGYSFFWSTSTIIYFLMRQKVDDTEMDEVYLEEDEPEDAYMPPSGQAAPGTTPGTTPLTMVEPPGMKPSSAPSTAPAPTAKPESSQSGGGSGNPPGSS